MKNAIVVALALAAGFVGGIFGAYAQRHYDIISGDVVIRANRFELLDATGSTKSFWGKDQRNNVVLVFENANRNRALVGQGGSVKIGLTDYHSPFWELGGADGRERARVALSEYDKPTLALSDESRARIVLGFISTDAHSPLDDDWALSFRPDVAGVGIVSNRRQQWVRGSMWVNRRGLSYTHSNSDLRGTWKASDDGKTYLVVADDNVGACPIKLDGSVWSYATGEPAVVTPGSHKISACDRVAVAFDIPQGTVYSFNYWGR